MAKKKTTKKSKPAAAAAPPALTEGDEDSRFLSTYDANAFAGLG